MLVQNTDIPRNQSLSTWKQKLKHQAHDDYAAETRNLMLKHRLPVLKHSDSTTWDILKVSF